MFSQLLFRHFSDFWNDGFQGLLERSDGDITLSLYSEMYRYSSVAVGKNHHVFALITFSLTQWLWLAKAFLNSVRKEDIAEPSRQFL